MAQDRGELVDRIRDFNRYYTRVLGLLDRHFLDSPFSLTEARVLYELARGGCRTAKELKTATGLDAGYLSRILDALLRSGLLRKTPDREDRRSWSLELSAKGRSAFARLDQAQQASVESLIADLGPNSRESLAGHMEAIRGLLGDLDRNGREEGT